MLPGIFVTDKLEGAGVEVLLRVANTLTERRGDGLIEYFNAAAWSDIRFQPIQPRVLTIRSARTDGPYLAGL